MDLYSEKANGVSDTCTMLITRREWFAAMALQGLLAAPMDATPHVNAEDFAEAAVAHADNLIAALAQKFATDRTNEDP